MQTPVIKIKTFQFILKKLFSYFDQEKFGLERVLAHLPFN